jgi:hypothetical protein
MQVLEHVPESAKLTTAIGPAAISLFGMPLDQWVYALSAVVSILVILEKLPKVIHSIKNLKDWITGKKDDPSTE